jgi:hypothetical protein
MYWMDCFLGSKTPSIDRLKTIFRSTIHVVVYLVRENINTSLNCCCPLVAVLLPENGTNGMQNKPPTKY